MTNETQTRPRIKTALVTPNSYDPDEDALKRTVRLSMTTDEGVPIEFDVDVLALTLIHLTANTILASLKNDVERQRPEIFNPGLNLGDLDPS